MGQWAGLCLGLAAATPALPSSPVDGARPVFELLAQAPIATLRQGNLRAEVALPDPARGFYRGTRFDWSGMILEVKLGHARFYGPWFDAVAPAVRDYVDEGDRLVTGPNTNATGPAEEFQGDNINPVPGYSEAPAGGTFVKIGVGRLRRADEAAYNRFNHYDIVDSGQWQVQRYGNRIIFVQTLPIGEDGYGYRYTKTVSLRQGGVLIIRHLLENIGHKTIQTQVYSHNFMRFGDGEVDQATVVRSPLLQGQSPKDPSLARVVGEQLRFLRPLAKGESVAFPVPAAPPIAGQPVFSVHRIGAGMIEAYSSSPITRALFWNIRKVSSVEPYVAIAVAPGERQAWAWRYTYSANQD